MLYQNPDTLNHFLLLKDASNTHKNWVHNLMIKNKLVKSPERDKSMILPQEPTIKNYFKTVWLILALVLYSSNAFLN